MRYRAPRCPQSKKPMIKLQIHTPKEIRVEIGRIHGGNTSGYGIDNTYHVAESYDEQHVRPAKPSCSNVRFVFDALDSLTPGD
jgi:hypothetical protein